MHKGESSEKKWSPKICTLFEPTNAFGKIRFPGSYSKTASVSIF